MMPANAAQRLLMALGAEPQIVLLGHYREKNRSHTKKGPGRRHMQGKRKEAA